MSELFGFFDGKNGQDFYADGGRFYKMEMTTAMSGQNAKENALVKMRISKAYFLEFAIIPAVDAEIDVTAIDKELMAKNQPLPSDVQVEPTELTQTVSYIAKPSDSRCAWWSVQLPADIELNDQRIPAPYLRKGADLELKQGDMLIDSEAMHHRKNRGYNTVLCVCADGEVKFIKPTAAKKAFIKANGGQDLMHESGDVAGCVRMAVWLRRQPDLSAAVAALKNV